MTKKVDVDEAMAEMKPISFSPKVLYLGSTMVVLLLANAFLASQKNHLQAELDRKDEQLLRLQTELSVLQDEAGAFVSEGVSE